MDGVAGRAVFTADPAFVAEAVDGGKDVGPADFAGAGLVAVRDVGDLHVGDEGHEGFHALRDVALGDLAVVDVELEAEAVAADGFDDGGALGHRVEVEAWHVAMVDGFDDEGDAAGSGLVGGPGEVGGVESGGGSWSEVAGGNAGHNVDEGVAECFGVVEGAEDAVAELLLAAGEGGGAALAGGPVAGGGVEEDLLQPGGIEAGADLGGFVVVGEEELNAAEAGLGGGVEAVEEWVFVEHHGQVGAKAGHGRFLDVGLAGAGCGILQRREGFARVVAGAWRLRRGMAGGSARSHERGDGRRMSAGTDKVPERVMAAALLVGLAIGCALVLLPFLSAILWGLILVYSTWPVYQWIRVHLRLGKRMAAGLMVLVTAVLIVLPIAVAAPAGADDAATLRRSFEAALAAGLPSAPGWLGGVPLVGQTLADYWNQWAADLSVMVSFFSPYFGMVAESGLKVLLGIAGGLLQFVMALLVAFFVWSSGDVLKVYLDRIAHRIVGEPGGAAGGGDGGDGAGDGVWDIGNGDRAGGC